MTRLPPGCVSSTTPLVADSRNDNSSVRSYTRISVIVYTTTPFEMLSYCLAAVCSQSLTFQYKYEHPDVSVSYTRYWNPPGPALSHRLICWQCSALRTVLLIWARRPPSLVCVKSMGSGRGMCRITDPSSCASGDLDEPQVWGKPAVVHTRLCIRPAAKLLWPLQAAFFFEWRHLQHRQPMTLPHCDAGHRLCIV